MTSICRAVVLATLLTGTAPAIGAGTPPAAGAASPRPTVVVTTNILGDIVTEVLDGVADVEILMPANADPHSFSISAAQAERLEQADLIVANGLALEGGVLQQRGGSRGHRSEGARARRPARSAQIRRRGGP